MLQQKTKSYLFQLGALSFALLLFLGLTFAAHTVAKVKLPIYNCLTCTDYWGYLLQTVQDFGFGLVALLFLFILASRWVSKKLNFK